MEVRPEHKNLWGTMHGGALASLIDSACGLATVSYLAENEGTVTLNLRVHYFAPVTQGKLTALFLAEGGPNVQAGANVGLPGDRDRGRSFADVNFHVHDHVAPRGVELREGKGRRKIFHFCHQLVVGPRLQSCGEDEVIEGDFF